MWLKKIRDQRAKKKTMEKNKREGKQREKGGEGGQKS